MKNKRKVYIHSTENDYLTEEYIDLFASMNAELLQGNEENLLAFIEANERIQLDTETNMTDLTMDRVLYVVQLGTLYGEEQHIFDIPDTSPRIHNILTAMFDDTEKIYLAHNAKFEYMILKQHFGVSIYNFKDTMLASRLITAGLDLPKGYNGLANLVLHRFGVDLSKASQTTFTGEKMTPEQLLYADSDVLYLGKLLDMLLPPLKKWGLMKCWNMENRCLRAIGDMSLNGILIDKEALAENIVTYDKEAEESMQEMIDAFKSDTDPIVQAKIEDLNIIQKEDEVIINWGSPTQKRNILNELYPGENIDSSAKPALLKLEKTVSNPIVISKLLNGNTEEIEALLVSRHLPFLKEHDMFKEKGQLNINFNSNAQLLEFLKIWHPSLSAVGVKDLKSCKTPVVMAYKKYTKAAKLVSSFGRKMYTYIESDGRIHTNFNQLVPTGSRMSSSAPKVNWAL